MFWLCPWLSADRRLQFRPYDQSMRELSMERTSFFNKMRMEPHMFDEILHRVGRRIKISCLGLYLVFRFLRGGILNG